MLPASRGWWIWYGLIGRSIVYLLFLPHHTFPIPLQSPTSSTPPIRRSAVGHRQRQPPRYPLPPHTMHPLRKHVVRLGCSLRPCSILDVLWWKGNRCEAVHVYLDYRCTLCNVTYSAGVGGGWKGSESNWFIVSLRVLCVHYLVGGGWLGLKAKSHFFFFVKIPLAGFPLSLRIKVRPSEFAPILSSVSWLYRHMSFIHFHLLGSCPDMFWATLVRNSSLFGATIIFQIWSASPCSSPDKSWGKSWQPQTRRANRTELGFWTRFHAKSLAAWTKRTLLRSTSWLGTCPSHCTCIFIHSCIHSTTQLPHLHLPLQLSYSTFMSSPCTCFYSSSTLYPHLITYPFIHTPRQTSHCKMHASVQGRSMQIGMNAVIRIFPIS